MQKAFAACEERRRLWLKIADVRIISHLWPKAIESCVN